MYNSETETPLTDSKCARNKLNPHVLKIWNQEFKEVGQRSVVLSTHGK